MTNDFLDVGAGGLQVLTGIEVIGMLVEVLTNSAGQPRNPQTQLIQTGAQVPDDQ